MNTNKYLRESYIKYFESCYGKIPSEEQLKLYMDYFLRKTDNVKKLTKVCKISIEEIFPSRDEFSTEFKALFGYKPKDDKLDLFISYSLGVVGDLMKVVKVCGSSSCVLSSDTPFEPAEE